MGAPSSPPLHVEQTYTQEAKGTIEVELGGKNGDQFDALKVNGEVTLAGTLDVALIDDFVPNVGDTFQVVTSTGGDAGPAGVTGKFASVSQPQSATVQVTYHPDDVTLGVTQVAAPAPDAGAGGSGSAGDGGIAGSPDTSSPGSSDSSGGCALAAPGGGAPFGAALSWLGLGLAMGAARRRRSRRAGA